MRESLECLLGISPRRRNPCGGSYSTTKTTTTTTTTTTLYSHFTFIQQQNYKTLYDKYSLLTKLIKCALNIALKFTFRLFLFFFAFWLYFRPPRHCLIPLFERQFFTQMTVERRERLEFHFLDTQSWEGSHAFLVQRKIVCKCSIGISVS